MTIRLDISGKYKYCYVTFVELSLNSFMIHDRSDSDNNNRT